MQQAKTGYLLTVVEFFFLLKPDPVQKATKQINNILVVKSSLAIPALYYPPFSG